MVRIAKKEELERVNEIRKQVSKLHSDAYPDVFRSDFCSELQNIVYSMWEDDSSDVIVLERDGKILGFANLKYIDVQDSPYKVSRKYCEILEIGVDEKFKHMGLGTELFDFIKKHAKQKGFSCIELDMWEFNQNALNFYEKMGFTTYRRYMKTDI